MLRTTATIATVAAFAFFSTNAAADTSSIPKALQIKIDAARSACADFENGEFALEADAIKRVDLNGDGEADWVVDEALFACSSAVSLYGGTGGSMSHFVIDGQVASIQNQGWQAVQFAPHIVVLARVHGSQCDGINPTPCITSSVWDNEQKVWRSASASWE